MFELPEITTLARQMNATLKGKRVQTGKLGNKPHKFVWYNRTHDEFERLSRGKTIGDARSKGRWLFLPLEPGYVLLLGECGGKVLYHRPGAGLPQTYHLLLAFDDNSALSATTQMWGAMELYEQGQEQERQYVKDMRPTPVEPEFSPGYFHQLVETLAAGPKRSVKGLLTQEQLIPGLGNAIAQDIMFRARLHPRHPLDELSKEQQQVLYHAILTAVQEVTEKGGRNDEYDLFNEPGGYERVMDRHAAGRPCPVCSATVEKIQYLGGACYFCPACQT